jgi:long-chain acyl-CoA synthetase
VQSHGNPTLIAARFGAFRTGLVLVPLDSQSTMPFIRQVPVDTQASAYIAPVNAEAPLGLPHVPLRPVPRSGSLATNHVVRSNDLAEIIFTSGTTSEPKGVTLTHGNITSNVRAAAVLPHGPEHRLLSVLPISHMLEQTGGIFLPLASGASIAFTHSIRSSALMTAFTDRHPTTLVAVPRLLDLLIQGIIQDIEKRGRLSHRGSAHRLAEHLPQAARRLLFLPFHHALGGSLRWIFSGGSSLDPRLQSMWQRMGISVLQGYGATECSPFVSCQRLTDNATGSTGRAFPGVSVRVADDGELLVRGPNVTPGYWGNVTATREVLHDGWYATGDIAQIDHGGHIKLLGRKREMIALPSGLNVYPADVDAELTREPEIDDAAPCVGQKKALPRCTR